MAISLSIQSITFSSGDTLELPANGVTVVVGPNNSGKTSLLREIQRSIKLNRVGPVTAKVVLNKHGDAKELNEWLERNVVVETDEAGGREYCWLNAKCSVNLAPRHWDQSEYIHLADILCTFLSVDERFAYLESTKVSGYIKSFDALTDAPPTPLHALQANDELEKRASRFFHKAFGIDLILNRGLGTVLALHCGEPPALDPGDDRVSHRYVERLSQLPSLIDQGHGMRSFAGCVIGTIASPSLIHLVDEPEAFLYPSQVRYLGRLLVSEKPEWRQLIIATHSGDLLHGILDSGSDRVSIVRLTRNGDVNYAKQLPANQVREVWCNPILRYSNVLDGLFHESVVVCESDGDCKFYAAILEAVQASDETTPDVLFTSSGGKQRMPVVVGSLVRLGVKTRVVADFDILREEQPLRGVIESLGGNWREITSLWSPVKAAIEQKLPPLTRDKARQDIVAIFDGSESTTLSPAETERIRKALREASIWDFAKHMGSHAVPLGSARQQLNDLLGRLRSLGLFVVEVGELEGFAPTIGGHGTRWVAEVLKRNLSNDLELEVARRFVADLFADAINQSIVKSIRPVEPSVTTSNIEASAPVKRSNLRSWITNNLGI